MTQKTYSLGADTYMKYPSPRAVSPPDIRPNLAPITNPSLDSTYCDVLLVFMQIGIAKC